MEATIKAAVIRCLAADDAADAVFVLRREAATELAEALGEEYYDGIRLFDTDSGKLVTLNDYPDDPICEVEDVMI